MLTYREVKRFTRLRLLRSLMPCGEAVGLMSESLDRSLTMRERLFLKLHLLVCAWCTRYLRQLKFMANIFRERGQDETLSPGKVIASLSSAARNRINAALTNSASSSDNSEPS